MQLFCNALIVELQDGRTVLSALVVHEKDLTLDQKRMLEKIGTDAKKQIELNTIFLHQMIKFISL